MIDKPEFGPAMRPEEVWQDLHPRGSFDAAGAHGTVFPATLPDGRQVLFPIRVLPGDGEVAVASLIVNQASFAVLDALADALAAALRPHAPEVIVAVPTLGLPLAEGVARRLGHSRLVPLGTSRKFWYRDDLSVPVTSITSPDVAKRLYLDPRMLPLLTGRPVAVIDDVISTGRTLRAVLDLMARAGVAPVAAGAAMLQGEGWRQLAEGLPVLAACATPRLRPGAGGWLPEG